MSFHDEDDNSYDMSEARLAALLGAPEVWEEPKADDADAIFAAIAAEAPERANGDRPPSQPVDELAARRSRRLSERYLQPLLSAAAGALIVLVGLGVISQLGDGSQGQDSPAIQGIELALAGTDLAPNASAEANVVAGRLGTRIDLIVTGLDPAPEGFYYEAWLRTGPEVGVSAGTFHLRGGDGEVELWAGVDPKDYPLLTVTLQPEAQVESSGQVVLAGLLPTEE